MTLKIVAIFDQATESFGRPIFVPHVGQSIRSFMDELRKPDSELSLHPGDYSLFELGDFDERFGTFNGHTAPRRLASGSDFVSKP
ncbi:MAG: nonstructural protein [Microviridae sp.]|nr:MAG: nonstructural protein [Microviridae sp.]